MWKNFVMFALSMLRKSNPIDILPVIETLISLLTDGLVLTSLRLY